VKKVLSYILISFVIFANLFAPILAQAVDTTNAGTAGQKIIDQATNANKNTEPVVGTADFEMQASTEATDTSVKLIVNINDKSSVLQNAEFGTIFDLILDINITDTTGKNIDGVTGLIDNQNRTNPFTQRFDKNFNRDAYTKIHDGKPIEYNFEGLNSETKYQVVMNLKESTFIAGVGTGTPKIIATSTAPFVTNSKGVTILVKQENTANINIQTPAKKMPACGIGSPMGCIAQGFYYVLFMPSSYLFALAGTFFDYTFSYSVQDSSYRSSFVVQGWGLVRDFCNIFFIFVMLYIAIGTILSLHGFKTKETIINVVIIGLFINFSLFAAQVIIDASNITARVFYNSDAIKITEKGANGVTEATPLLKVGDGGIIPLSAAIVNKVNPQNMILHSGKITQIPDKGGASSTDENPANMDASTFILIVIMASAVNIVGLTVFFTIGFLFVARVIGLWLAMIMAPLAFFTYILPQLEGVKMIGWKNWWPETLKLAFLAPVFIFFMYLILKFLSMDLISDAMSKSMSTDGLAYFAATLIPFVFIIILMLKAKNIAVGMSGEFGEMATKLGSSVGGMVLGGAAGAGAMVMRRTIGAAGDKLATSEFAKNNGRFGRMLGDAGKWTAKSSFDARNTKLGGMATKELKVDMGKAKEGGYVKYKADVATKRRERADSLNLGNRTEQVQELHSAEEELSNLKNESINETNRIDGTLAAKRLLANDLYQKLTIANEQLKLPNGDTQENRRIANEAKNNFDNNAALIADYVKERTELKTATGRHAHRTGDGKINEDALLDIKNNITITETKLADTIKNTPGDINAINKAQKEADEAKELFDKMDKIAKTKGTVKSDDTRSLDNLELKIIPHLHHVVEQENAKRTNKYAKEIRGRIFNRESNDIAAHEAIMRSEVKKH